MLAFLLTCYFRFACFLSCKSVASIIQFAQFLWCFFSSPHCCNWLELVVEEVSPGMSASHCAFLPSSLYLLLCRWQLPVLPPPLSVVGGAVVTPRSSSWSTSSEVVSSSANHQGSSRQVKVYNSHHLLG